MLSEMDGFEANQGVVIMAATNHPEVLDKALLRPGRFDRQIQVGLPTEEARRQILKIHTREVTIIPTARRTLGYTMQMPEEDQYLLDQRELGERLAVMLDRRTAELLVVGEPSTRAANDLERSRRWSGPDRAPG